MAVKEIGKPLEPYRINVLEPGDDESVLVKIGGAGICRTDLRLWEGREPRPGFNLPFVMGHENAGVVEKIGSRVRGLKKGDAVIVYAVWGDLSCKYCRNGNYMMCKDQAVPGQSYYFGGYAEYLFVPNYRFLCKIGDLNPIDAAPLADAGLTSYSAVQKILPRIYPDCFVVIYGIGGLASYAIQILKSLAPLSKIVAVSRTKEKLDWAKEELGADLAFVPMDLKEGLEEENIEAIAAIDFVGTEDSTMSITGSLEPGGVIVEVGMEGEKLSMPTFATTVWQYELIGSNYGTFNELVETIQLARSGKLTPKVTTRKLEEANEALSELRTSKSLGRYVLVP